MLVRPNIHISKSLAQLGCYEYCKRRFRDKGLDIFTSCFLAGGIGTVFCWIVSYPMDIVKTKLQVKTGERGLIRDQARQIWNAKGLPGFYQGISPTLCRGIIAGSFNFLAYESVKNLLY
jgi:hypothetical protein